MLGADRLVLVNPVRLVGAALVPERILLLGPLTKLLDLLRCDWLAIPVLVVLLTGAGAELALRPGRDPFTSLGNESE